MFTLARLHALTAVTALAIVAGGASVAVAAPLYVSYDNFSYSGTVTKYGTLTDAQNGTNVLSNSSIATATNGSSSTLTNSRDGQVYMASGAPAPYETSNYSYFLPLGTSRRLRPVVTGGAIRTIPTMVLSSSTTGLRPLCWMVAGPTDTPDSP